MPKIDIQARAQLVGIKSIGFRDDHPFHLTLRCCNCGEVRIPSLGCSSVRHLTFFVQNTPKPVVISKEDEVQGVRGAKVTASLKCSLCSRVNDITILKLSDYELVEDGEPQFQTIVSLECRGLEPSALIFADDSPLNIVATSDTRFEDGALLEFERGAAGIELGEWYDFDSKTSTDVSVTEFEIKFSKAS